MRKKLTKFALQFFLTMPNLKYTGLTAAEVLENRARYGANILTPPKKETLLQRALKTLKYWISVGMLVLCVLSLGLAVFLSSHTGAALIASVPQTGAALFPSIWMMPAVVMLATVMIFLVGFFGGFKDPLFKILITAFVLSMGISIYEFECTGAGLNAFFEPVGIIAALLLATGVAFFLERANEKTFQSLNSVNDDTPVKVIRDGAVGSVPRRDIVVGDVVMLETGEEIPADCQLLESMGLSVNESSLTGEPQAAKTTEPADFDPEATYPSDHIMKGTTVTEGYCTARVLSVGDKTESGKVFVAAQVQEGERTPLSQKLDTLAGLITNASYLVAGLIVIGRIAVYIGGGNLDLNTPQGFLDLISYVLGTFMIAVTLIVVAVPEGLPMSVTLSLAFSMKKLMKENALPRTMHACETMGAAGVICTDKTGTLTQNKMQVHEAQLCIDDMSIISEMISANTTADLDAEGKVIGNPTDGALLLWLSEKGVDYQTVRDAAKVLFRLPFCTQNKYMASIIEGGATGRRLYLKGAPEIVMGFSSLTAESKTRYDELLHHWQDMAMRTLALAYLDLPDSASIQDVISDGKLQSRGLNFAGVFAISDPVRTDVPQAIKTCLDAGIAVKIVTGDTSGTAREIGRQIGLWTPEDGDHNILTGTEFAALTDEQVMDRVIDLKIMSRARPTDKERLVRALKAKGLVVAVTGDGTNDAPALNAADAGLSMGDGTAIAKEASDMTILDDSFSTIANAVMWGRSLYKNIQRFVMFQTTINVVACLIVLIGAFTGTESPLSVTQMLWVNLIMDTFAAIALASLPPQRIVMKEKPRKGTDSIINKAMAWNIFGVGGLLTMLLLGILLLMQHSDLRCMGDLLRLHWGPYDGLSAYELSLFFTLFVMLQFWNMFNAKAFMTGRSALKCLRECRGFMSIAAVVFVGQILIVEFGGQMFNVVGLRLSDWLSIILSTSLVLWIGELFRGLKRK